MTVFVVVIVAFFDYVLLGIDLKYVVIATMDAKTKQCLMFSFIE